MILTSHMFDDIQFQITKIDIFPLRSLFIENYYGFKINA